jgi:hypothetical protein
MSPATGKMLTQVIRLARGILTALEEWVKDTQSASHRG